MSVPSFKFLGLTVPEKSVTKNFNVWKLERKKNEEIKRRISSSSLNPLYTIHLPTVHVRTKFQSSRPHSSWEKCDEIFSFERLRNEGIAELQNDGRTWQIQYCPHFFKRDYNNAMSSPFPCWSYETEQSGIQTESVMNCTINWYLKYDVDVAADLCVELCFVALQYYLSLITRKPVFGVYDQIIHKPTCAATKAR